MPPHSTNAYDDSVDFPINGNCYHSITTDSFNVANINHDIKSSSRTTGPLHKSVKFAAYDEVLEIPNIDDMSDEEIDSVWYTSKDLSDIRDECLLVIESFDSEDNTILMETKNFCMRGLEGQTEKNWTSTCRTRDILYDIVWRFQELQKREGVVYPDMILAELCQSRTMQSQQEAEIIGLCDAINVHQC